MNFPDNIPSQSVLGINYSGMHDSSIAIVAPDGTPVFAVSLERVTRIKQDGRPPYALLEKIPWDRIAKIAVSTNESLDLSRDVESIVNTNSLTSPRPHGWKHADPFYEFLNGLPCEKVFVSHQLSHASSAFWGSEFEEALCLTCDGGMYNDLWFGGVYRCDRTEGIVPLDHFSVMKLSMVTSLYTFVTALLGFTPNKHEGKITGLAAYGKSSERCQKILERWFTEDYYKLESTLRWIFSYSETTSPQFLPDSIALQPFRDETNDISREELAASVQNFAEQYVLEILEGIKKQGWVSDNICLAGGLFANVKINQRVVETGFEKLFVAPPMTDDGTALGAAWHVLSGDPNFNPKPLHSMYLGPSYSKEEIGSQVAEKKIQVRKPVDPAKEIASILAKGGVVALYQGAAEFGPRALGNRSILASATDPEINQTLNERLNRTEFMPFAPISRMEDAEQLYKNICRVQHSAEFMTVTVDCSEKMKEACPATVHIDGTARPQLVSRDCNPLVHDILTQYQEDTGIPALVNTSFNVHEQPIVSSPEDALRGFFLSGLDYLYLDEVGLISFKGNEAIAIEILQEAIKTPSQRQTGYSEAKELLLKERSELIKETEQKEVELSKLEEKEEALLKMTREAEEKETELLKLEEKELFILKQGKLLEKYDSRFRYWRYVIVPTERLLQKLFFPFVKLRAIFLPRIGILHQYAPRDLCFPDSYHQPIRIDPVPKISIVTPSFKQAEFIERTLNSVFDQEYENLEYYVQDGGSKDGTKEILEKYSDRLTGWESKPDTGQTNAINLGFAKTNGEIMAWLNSDDIILPGTLAYVADYFNRHPEVDVVYGNRLQIDINDQHIGRWIMPAHDDEVLSWADFIPQETLYWRRSIWEKAGGQVDESFRFAMDWDFLVRLREAGARFARLPRFMGGFRIHPDQKTSAEMSDVGFREMNRIRERLLGRTPSEKEIFKAVKPYLLKHVITDLKWRVRNMMGNPS
ncbi:MAG: glycosyltransferase [Nitrospina sp.]|jgi:predicted NodU family carbamoyl transferase/glycosyltransferase involved in cell wall biosynthesis|nr:glycosyltransferase [Nitrospina sp.]MBT6718116.1 glycosyltransferase [Nitrospina sp.]